jgi:hypothetical protein
VARQPPLNSPQWAAPLIRRLAGVCASVAILTYLAAIAISIAITGLGPTDPAVQVVSASMAIVAAVLVVAWVSRSRVAPLYEVIEWSMAVATARWNELGLGTAIPDPAGALAALAGRDDEPAVAARTTLLAGLGRADDLEAALAAWEPQTPLGVATLARHRATLDSLRGGTGDTTAALAAAHAIPEPPARTRTLALIHLDAAVRAASAGRSPEAELRAARRTLHGPLDVPVPRDRRNLVVLAAGLVVVSSAVPIAVACLVAGGVVALAAWVAIVAAFVVGLRMVVGPRRTATGGWQSGGGRDPELPAGSGRR